MANMFSGMRVIVDANAVKDGDPVAVTTRLSWRERLCLTSYHDWLTRPFQPWVSTRTVMVTPKVPAYFIVNGSNGPFVIMHPKALETVQLLDRGRMFQ